MTGTKLLRLARRMQRIRQKQQRIGERGIFRRGHRRLTPAIGVPARKYASSRKFAKRADRPADAFPIPGRLRRKWRTMRARPPVRQIESQHHISRSLELPGDRLEQRRLRVRSRAMRDREPVARRRRRLMQPASYGLRLKEFRRQFRLSPTPSGVRPRSIARSRCTA